ncbi:MAG: anti-sigma factor [Planctomycetota bacterium]
MISPNPERIEELLADRAVFGLSSGEDRELAALLSEHPAADGDVGLDLEEAALALALTGPAVEPPESLTRKLSGAAERWVEEGKPAPAAEPGDPYGERPAVIGYIGWLAAAAAIAIAATAWFNTAEPTTPSADDPDIVAAPSPAEQAAALAQQPGAVVLPWAQFDAEYQGVTGDVVWSQDQQRGYMRLTGLKTNDPAQAQYQLWIVDAQRDATFPVDGGLFDVTEAGDVVVPFTPRLPIGKAAAFAITVEQPGGVVKSAGPLRVVAPAATG